MDMASTSQTPATPSPSRKTELELKVVEAVKRCYDPEIPVNVYDLGLIYSIDVADDDTVALKMTLTAPACPVAGTLPGEVERAARSVQGVKDARVELVWDPPWHPGMMSKMARVMLGF